MLEKNEWWSVIAKYNESIFPFQWMALILLIVLTIFLIFRDKKSANKLIKLTLSMMNIFIGVGFFIMSKGFPIRLRLIQGLLFVIIGVLLFSDIFKNKYEFQFPENGWKRIFFIVGMIFMMIYPFVGIFQGKEINYCIIQGTLPCPTTAYTLILIITAYKRYGKFLYILLLFWAIPFPIFIQLPKYGVYEDAIMCIIGIVGLINLIYDIKFNKDVKESSNV